MRASYQSHNPRAAWIKKEDFVRRPRCRRNEASPDGYDQQEAARIFKRVKIEPPGQRNNTVATNVSTQAISSSPTSPAFPTSSPQPTLPALGRLNLPAGTAGVPLAAVASPPPPQLTAPSTPSTPTTSESLKSEQPPVNAISVLTVESPVDATSDLSALSSSTSASKTSTAVTSSTSTSSSTPRPTSPISTPMSTPSLGNNLVQEEGNDDAAILAAPVLPPTTTSTTPSPSPSPSSSSSSSSATTRSIRNKALEDGDSNAALPLAQNAAAEPTDSANVLLDSESSSTTPTPESGVILDTDSTPTVSPAQSVTGVGAAFSAITLLPGESPSPSSSSSSSSKTKTKKKCSSATGSAKSVATPAPGTLEGNAVENTSSSSSSSSNHSKQNGIIAGSIVGAIAAIALLSILLLFCYKRRKSRRTPSPSPSVPKRRSPYGRFSFHNITSSLPSLSSLPPLPFINHKRSSNMSPTSEKSSRTFAFLRRGSRSPSPVSSASSEKRPRATSYSGAQSPRFSSSNRRSSSMTSANPFLPEQSTTDGTLDIAPAFRALSPVVESPRPNPPPQAINTGTAIPPAVLTPLRNPFESPRKATAASSESNYSNSQAAPPSPTASSVTNMLASPKSFHTRSSGVLLPDERVRESSVSSSRTISLPPAYPQHSRSVSEPEASVIEAPNGPWRDSLWSVAATPMGATPRGSAGWGGMGWPGNHGNPNNYGPHGGYGNNGGFAHHRASKSSSHYTDSSDSRDTVVWQPTAVPSALFSGQQSTSQALAQGQSQIPRVPRIPNVLNKGIASSTSAALSDGTGAAPARTVHQRHPAVRAIPSAYIGGARHSRRKSSVGAPNWEGERPESDGSNASSGAAPISGNASGRSNQSSAVPGTAQAGRASDNSVATVFRVHPGEPVRF